MLQQTNGAQSLKRALRVAKADNLLDQQANQNQILNKALLQNKFGCMCLQGEKYQLANKHLSEALLQLELIFGQFTTTNLYMNIANLYAQQKQFDLAIKNYHIVINHSPYADEKQHNLRSVVWSGKLNSYEAYCDAHTNLACLLSNTDHLDEAYEFCIKAVELNPHNFEAQTNLGDLMRQIGKREEGITHTWNLIVEHTNEEGQNYIQPVPIDCIQLPPPQQDNQRCNIVCVKWGTKYGPHYVNRLFYGIKRNTTKEFVFHCYTDDSHGLDESVVIHPLIEGWTGWWGKATLFAENSLKGRQFFIDLDMIITGNIDNILSYSGNFGILKTDDIKCEKGNKNGYNSSIMAWSSNTIFKSIYEQLNLNHKNIRKFIVRFDFWLEMMVKNADFFQEIYPYEISDYLLECQENLPQKTRIVCFPRTPKPHEAKATWIPQYWF